MQDKPSLIKSIHAGKTRLGIDEATYRAMIAAHAPGKQSSKDCTVRELASILAHLRKAGFAVRQPGGSHRRLDQDAQSKMIRGLWLFLSEIGAVKDKSETALAAYVRRHAGVDDLRWVTDAGHLNTMIEGLKAWAARSLPGAIDARIVELRAVGRIAPQVTRATLIDSVRGSRSPKGYAALAAAWKQLAAIDDTHATG